ncbi:hypothetical protein [Geobacillus stearothermophilus]|uniref:hypothetical protein n=1 Tax=Geobacillus stearothermophilus TaxID=1422 RepID=UPI003D1CDACD
MFKDILDYLLKQEDLLINLSDLVISNGYFFHHSVNVATIAGVIGIAKGYRPEQLLDLGIGALPPKTILAARGSRIPIPPPAAFSTLNSLNCFFPTSPSTRSPRPLSSTPEKSASSRKCFRASRSAPSSASSKIQRARS